MKTRGIIVLASAIVLFSASILLAVNLSGKQPESKLGIAVAKSISERQPEPTDDFSNDFASKYVAENKTAQNGETDETTIPCFREDELLFGNLGCFSLGVDADWDYTHNIQWDFMGRVVKMFPNPLVRETEDNYYLVYQSDNNTRLFLFYSTINSQGMFLGGYPIIMKEMLSYKDFSEIQVGNSIEKVGSIDSIIPVYSESFEMVSETVYKTNKEQGIYFTSMHLLSDGILRIDYDRKDGDYVIIDITYNKDFVLEGKYQKTCYKIFEMDYLA
jgi:hypothetical protein